jgi:hypothetical protein
MFLDNFTSDLSKSPSVPKVFFKNVKILGGGRVDLNKNFIVGGDTLSSVDYSSMKLHLKCQRVISLKKRVEFSRSHQVFNNKSTTNNSTLLRFVRKGF